jgi:hypothetical protein
MYRFIVVLNENLCTKYKHLFCRSGFCAAQLVKNADLNPLVKSLNAMTSLSNWRLKYLAHNSRATDPQLCMLNGQPVKAGLCFAGNVDEHPTSK